MIRPDPRHYTEEELLLHALREESLEDTAGVGLHVSGCRECSAVLAEYQEVLRVMKEWEVPELPEDSWLRRKAEVMAAFRRDQDWLGNRGPWLRVRGLVRAGWDYALENPLPTLGYIAAAAAFASERTITLFRLDRLLPATGELIEILRQAL